MLKNLFGSKKDEKKPQSSSLPSNQYQQQSVNIEREQQFNNQEKLISIKRSTEEARQNVENFYGKLARKENQIKELLKVNKREEARRQLALFKTMKDQIITLESLCTTLEKECIKLEINMQNVNLVKAIQTANELQKGQEKLRDNLENVLMDLKEQQAQENEIRSLVQEISQGDTEETEQIDDMLDQFEKAIMDEKMADINKVPLKKISPIAASPAEAITSKAKLAQSNNNNKLIIGNSSSSGGSSIANLQTNSNARVNVEDDLDELLQKTASMN